MRIENPERMAELGARIAAELRAGDLVLLNGELGAGKTTLTRGIGAALGVRGAVTSPTFVLARTHPREGKAPLVHVDAYRLTSAMELDDLDIDFSSSIVIVEWGADLMEGIADEWLSVDIVRPHGGQKVSSGAVDENADENVNENTDENADVEPREVSIAAHGARWAHSPLLS